MKKVALVLISVAILVGASARLGFFAQSSEQTPKLQPVTLSVPGMT